MIVLDTHALIWWVAEPKRVPAKARRLCADAVAAGDPLTVSSISMWEIAILVERGRLALTLDVGVWINHVEALPFLRFAPVDNRIAVRSVQLADFPHRDPADRLIVATAIGLDGTLVTGDARLRRYRGVRTLWD